MLTKLNTKNKVLTLATIAIVFCGLIGFGIALKNAGHVPPHQFQNTVTTSITAEEPFLPASADIKQSADQALNVENAVEQKNCSSQCRTTLALLDTNQSIDDDTFRKLTNSTTAIATYLQGNDQQRQHYLEMALTTTDEDKRSFITKIFKHLPSEQRKLLAKDFIDSDHWRTRAAGVELITVDSEDLNNTELTNILSNETNSYVQSTILRHLKNNEALKGDLTTLNQLDLIINNASNHPSARVSALKTKLALSEQPYLIVPDAVQALYTNEPSLQSTGLIMIDQLLRQEEELNKNGVYLDKKSIKDVLQNIRNTNLEGIENKRLEQIIKESNAVYQRYF